MVRHVVLTLIGCALLSTFGFDSFAGEKKPKGPPLLLDEKGEFKKDPKPDSRKFPVKLEAGTIYRIEAKSDKFDAALRLEDDAGKIVAEDDDSAGSLNPRIYFKAGKSGEYHVILTSKNRQVGSFTVTAAIVTDRKVASEFPTKPIELKLTADKAAFKGSLDQNDANISGRYYKAFTLTLDQGKRYQIEQRSSDFDSYLILEDADGKRLADNDDHGKSVNARLEFAPPKSAVYRIIATSMPTRQTGSFVIEIAINEPKKD
jgi:hypothetical protein